MPAMRSLFRAALFAAVAASAARAQTVVNIHDIMTNLPNSPYLGQNVKVTGVVVGVVNQNANPTLYTPPGFFIANTNASWDTKNATAEGMQVETIIGIPCAANVGDLVTVTGTVVGSNILGTTGPGINGAQTPGTLLTCNALSTNGTSSVSNTVTLPTTASSFGQLLPDTGAPAGNNVLYAISPTSGFPDPANPGMVASSGQFWAVLKAPTNGGHLFKSAGLAADNYYPQSPPAPAQGSTPGIPTWTANPQRLFVDTATLGGQPIDVGAGQVLTCTPGAGLTVGATAGIGIVDYSLGYSRLLLFKTTTCVVSGSIAPSITAPAQSDHFHVGTLNLANFQNQSSSINPALYSRRVAKAAIAIVNILGQPDILSVQEVQDLATLQAIGDAASALTTGVNYQAYLSPTTDDATNLSLGFLVNTNTVAVNKAYVVNAADTFTRFDGTTEPLFERPPFVLETGLLRNGQNYQVEVVDLEMTTRVGIDDPTNGINLWQRRGAQAQALAVFANAEQLRGQNMLLAGEYNAYSFSDGFVDPIDIIANTAPPASGTVAQYEPGVQGMTPMYNFVKSITVSNSTYNVIEQGNARSIEHILCSQTQNSSAAGSIYSYISTVVQPHWTTDYPAIDANDPTIAAGLTDRDGFVGAFLIPPVPTTAGLTPTAANFGSVYRTQSATQTFTFTNTSTFPSTVTVQNLAFSGANAGDFSQTSNCTSLNQGASCTINVTFAPSASGARSATLTVTSDAQAEGILTATLTGTGVDTTAGLAPLTEDFGSIDVTGTTAAQTFTFTNTTAGLPGPPAESVLSATATGDFAVSANTCGTVAAGASCAVSVVFTPTLVGMRSGTLTVTNSSTANPTLTASLTGTGLDTTATLLPLTATFPGTLTGTTSAPLTFTWTNTSTVPLTIKSTTTTGDFAVSSTTCNGSIAAGASCTVAVTFTPSTSGMRAGSVSVASSSTLDPVLTATLNGTGTSDLELSSTQVNFGNVDLGFPSKWQTVLLTNHSPTVVALSSFASSAEYTFTTTCGATLSSQQTCAIVLTFTPTALGAQAGTFQLATDDASARTITVGLTGNGVDFSLSLAPNSSNIVAGLTAMFSATLTPLGGFSGFTNTFCTLPQVSGSVCTAEQMSMLSGSSKAVLMSISTTSPYTIIGYEPAGVAHDFWMALMALLSVGGLGFSRRRRGLRWLCVAVLLAACGMSGLGCSGKYPAKNANPTLPGTYVYTITLTDGQLVHTANYTLTVRND